MRSLTAINGQRGNLPNEENQIQSKQKENSENHGSVVKRGVTRPRMEHDEVKKNGGEKEERSPSVKKNFSRREDS